MEGMILVTATPDLSHVLLRVSNRVDRRFQNRLSGRRNTKASMSGPARPGRRISLPALLSLIPPADASLCGGTGPACAPAAEALRSAVARARGSVVEVGGSGGELMRNAVSADGSRVVFESARTSGTEHLSCGRTLGKPCSWMG